MNANIETAYRDNNYIALIKPVGIPSQPDKTGDKSLLEYAEEITGKTAFILNRLDRPVGGITLFALNKKSAAKFARIESQKLYVAAVLGDVPDEGVLEDYLVKNSAKNTSSVAAQNAKGAKYAKLKYEKIKTIQTDEYGALSLLKIELITGRHHQIRVQFASRGYPLWGDKKYGRAAKGRVFPALFACGLEFGKIKISAAPSAEPFSFFDIF